MRANGSVCFLFPECVQMGLPGLFPLSRRSSLSVMPSEGRHSAFFTSSCLPVQLKAHGAPCVGSGATPRRFPEENRVKVLAALKSAQQIWVRFNEIQLGFCRIWLSGPKAFRAIYNGQFEWTGLDEIFIMSVREYCLGLFFHSSFMPAFPPLHLRPHHTHPPTPGASVWSKYASKTKFHQGHLGTDYLHLFSKNEGKTSDF